MLTEISWPLSGKTIPADHCYHLFGALCHLGIMRHGDGDSRQLLAVRGQYVPVGALRLNQHSAITVRLPVVEAMDLMHRDIMGEIVFAGATVVMGPATIRKVSPTANLFSRLVTTKHIRSADDAARVAESQLAYRNVSAAKIEIGNPRCQTINGHKVTGFEVRLLGMNPSDSLAMLEHGIGGCRHMGCGVFVPC